MRESVAESKGAQPCHRSVWSSEGKRKAIVRESAHAGDVSDQFQDQFESRWPPLEPRRFDSAKDTSGAPKFTFQSVTNVAAASVALRTVL